MLEAKSHSVEQFLAHEKGVPLMYTTDEQTKKRPQCAK